MKLQTIEIRNYRSIEQIVFDVLPLDDGTFTYGLIGVNEAGKSSILKALALKDGLKNAKGEPLPLQKDFRDKTKPIEIEYTYLLDEQDALSCSEHLTTASPTIDVSGIDFTQMKLTAFFNFSTPSQIQQILEIVNIPNENQNKQNIQDQLKKLISDRSHKSIFWTAEDRYLISLPINLAQFATTPGDISIPLKNCFALAGISDITARISSLTGDSTEVEQLQTELGTKVTEHINTVWPKHPIEITFLITDGLIHFHVKDLDTKGKAKTADQRSDGFRQFVSFLLTVSAQNKNEELSNAILLLDEPETHLHPQAQEDLLRELVKITQNKRNNLAFFATHSNYMIDKDDLSRNFKIKKPKEKTEKEKFDKKISTYASVTYEVFDIPSTDYHNELYGKLHEQYQDADTTDDKRSGVLNFDTAFLNTEKGLKNEKTWTVKINQATLPTYIRNCIHHPDNGDTYKDADLRKSIELLRSY